MRTIVYHRHAVRQLKRIPTDRKEQIKAALANIATLAVPTAHPNVTLMSGDWKDCQRLRVGGYRAIYRQVEREGTAYIEVLQIGSRGDVYKS